MMHFLHGFASVSERPRPWHLLLSPALPVLSFLSANLSTVPPREAIWPLSIIFFAVLLAWISLTFIVGNGRAAALVISVVTFVALAYPMMYRVASFIPLWNPAFSVYILAAGVCVLILRRGGTATVLTTVANTVLLVATITVALPMTWAELRRPESNPVPGSTLEAAGPRAIELPDIYVLVLDGYGRADVLRQYYGFQNPLVAELQSLGFSVADKAWSNYPQTAQSLASALNLNYLSTFLADTDRESEDRRLLAELIAHNRLFTTLRSAGYRVVTYDSEYPLVRPEGVDERLGPWTGLTQFGYSLYERSVAPTLLASFGLPRGWLPAELHRYQVHWTLNRIEQERGDQGSRPTLVFAHVLMPHPPFTFRADGTARATVLPMSLFDGNEWRAMAVNSGETYEAGYVDAVRYLNSRLVTIVRNILTRANRPTIFLIQGDHGPGSHFNRESAEETDLHERFAILFAMRFPEGTDQRINSSITPVNGFRLLLNRAIGTQLPLLEDRAYFTTWSRPFEFVDVTDSIPGFDGDSQMHRTEVVDISAASRRATN